MAAPHTDGRRIIIVLGPGRSGTSTIAGTLAMTGLEVPGHQIKSNETNPGGFYEPRWVVDLHKDLLATADIAELDTSPRALERINSLTAKVRVRNRLRDWLEERLATQPHLVVKDPRAVWFQELWAAACGELGVEQGYVTMLRHPAEVAGSREKYYQKAELEDDRKKQILRIAGWINVALVAEQVTQGQPRNFVVYRDLVADWRKTLTRIADTQSLELDPPADASPHPVDDFIDPTLHRVKSDWETVGVPDWLSDLGERSWLALTALAGDGDTEDRRTEVARLRDEYTDLVSAATALTLYERRRRERVALKRGRKQALKGAAEASRAQAADEAAEGHSTVT